MSPAPATRRGAWTILDQCLSSLTNFALAVLVARQLDADGFGAFGLAFLAYTLVLGLARATSGEPLIVRFSATLGWGGSADRPIAEATGYALVLGIVVGGPFAVVGGIVAGNAGAALLALGLSLPGLLVQDTWREVFLAQGRPARAVANDAIWAAAQGGSVALVIASGHRTVFWFTAAWGAAASVAAVAGIVQSGIRPAPARAATWLRSTWDLGRHYSGEFVARAGARQLAITAVGITGGLSALGAIRAAQVLFGPLQVLLLGANLVATPEAVRIWHRDPDALRPYAVRLSASLALVAFACGLGAMVIPDSIGVELLGASWREAQPVLVPQAALMAGIGATSGALVGLRATAESQRSFRARISIVPLTVVGGVVGAAVAGSTGALTGLALANAIGAGLFWRQLDRALAEHPATAPATATATRGRVPAGAAVDPGVDGGPTFAPSPRPPVAGSGMLTGALVIAALVTAGAGYGLGRASSTVVLGVALGALAAAAVAVTLVRFEVVVLGALAVRASLDIIGSQRSGQLDPASVTGFALILATLLWLTVQTMGHPHRYGPVTKGAVAFVAASSVSVLGSVNPSTSAVEALRILTIVMMFAACDRLLADRRRVSRVLVAVYVSAFIPVLVGIHQQVTRRGRVEIDTIDRVRGTFLHPNPYAMYLAFLVIAGIALAPVVRGVARVALVAATAACAVGLVSSYARGAWIATFLGIVVVAVLRRSRGLLVVLVGSVIAIALLVPSTVARFTELEDTRNLSGTAGNSLVWRFEYWGDVLELADANPVTGIGLDTTAEELVTGKAPHNDFLRIFVETGVVGLFGYLWFMNSLVRGAREALRATRTARAFDRAVVVAFAGCITAFVTLSIAANVVSQVAVVWYLAAFACCANALVPRSALTPPPDEATRAPVAGPGVIDLQDLEGDAHGRTIDLEAVAS